MRFRTLLRFWGIGVGVALALGLVSLFALRELNESSTGEVRRNMLLFIAQQLESGGSYPETVQRLHAHSHRYERDETESHHVRRRSDVNLWVLSPQGQVLANSPEAPPPIAWPKLRKPAEPHEITFHYRFLSLVPDLALVKLDTPDGAFLLAELRRPASSHAALWPQLALAFFILGMSFLLALALAYAYLRRKSREARAVLSRLEKGDLRARFEIKRMDEIGSLMLDFNRMASEIERLVHRVRETESARKHLLEELSHDLRTPLTSLNTSAETLSDQWDAMPRDQQRELVSMVRAELGYFRRLIEDLFFIAALGEPRYQKNAQALDLAAMLEAEAKNRRASSTLSWQIEAAAGPHALGDPILIQRLFKNTLDNAAKHAASAITVRVIPRETAIEVRIEDDGPGISDEAVASFGHRRKTRIQTGAAEGVSLGLGSVIMKTILDLHGGHMAIGRKAADGPGTVLTITLPRE